jgi:hypothetical protein
MNKQQGGDLTQDVTLMTKVYNVLQNGEVVATFFEEIRARNEAMTAIDEGEEGITVAEDFISVKDVNNTLSRIV